MSDIAVIGAGAWGTALAVLWAAAGRRVTLVAREATRARALEEGRQNPRLAGVKFPDSLVIGTGLVDAEITVLCVPMQFARPALAALGAGHAPLVLCCKGLETGSLLLPPELARAVCPARPAAFLTGPNFAHEVASGLPAAAVLATDAPKLLPRLAAMLSTPSFRLYGCHDVIGAALGGAAKNVIAIAAGVVTGAGLGENARAALITRGLAEIARLAAALGGRAETLSGLSGMGDLLLTCTGEKSRNFSLGLALGKGVALPDILAARESVTEGVATAPALLARAVATQVEMPIVEAVTALLAGRTNVAQTMAALMGRALRDE